MNSQVSFFKQMKRWKKTKSKSSSVPFPLILIILLAAILRFYKLSELFHWTLDEEYWSYVPFNIATGYHLPLIGGHISGTGLYSGPLFVWLMSLPVWLTGGSPLGIATVVSLMGVVTLIAMYWVGKLLFDTRTGLIAALIWASSMLAIIYDRKYWNASPIPLLALLAILCLWKISCGKIRWSYPLAVVLALAVHAHATGFVLFLSTALGWAVFGLPVKSRVTLGAVGVFVLLQTPLLLFELRHDFLNSRALVGVISQSGTQASISQAVSEIAGLVSRTAGRLIYLPQGADLVKELTLCSAYASSRFIPPLLVQAVALLPLAYLLRKSKETPSKLLLLVLVVNVGAMLLYRLTAAEENWYPGQLSEYFLFPSLPVFVLAAAAVLTALMKRPRVPITLTGGVLGIFVISNVSSLLTARHSDGYLRKAQLVDMIAEKVGGERFSLEMISDDPCLQYGYRYLFTLEGKEPVRSYLDPMMLWLYERRLPKGEPTLVVTIERRGQETYYRMEQTDVASD